MEVVCRLRLLGVPGFERDGVIRPITAPPKALALLGYLALQREPATRSQLAGLLWGETTDQRSRRNLTHTLGQIAAVIPGCLQAAPQIVGLAPAGAVWTDVHACAEFLAHPNDANHPTHLDPQRISDLERGVSLYRGEFLAGLVLPGCSEFETWLVRERERWRQQVITSLIALVRHYTYQRHNERAEWYVRRLVELEPWHEEGHRALMLLLASSGRRSEALASYEWLQRMLASELGVSPADETRALYERIRSGMLLREVGVSTQAMQVAVGQAALPAAQHCDWGDAPPARHCYGRVNELAGLEALVFAQRCRVVAVLGMGGIGKTLLTAYFARTRSSGFAAVVWRSLVNAPPLPELLRSLIAALADEPRRRRRPTR
ncbi:MAG: hypothetical protein HC822_12810 [Oscillochloris sp.]|nr:hypothetical protein [Oscillochloris sp.]